MEHLEVGDEVFDEQGRPTRVVATTDPMTDRQCYQVLLSDGSRFIADAQHLWVTRTKAERGRGLPGTSRTTQQLAATVRAGQEWNHHVALAGPAQYPDRTDLPVDPYVLGTQAGPDPVPDAYLTSGYEQRLALLQGLMDSDGYADEIGRCEFVSTLEHLSDAVVELAASPACGR